MKNIVFVIKSKNHISLPETDITDFSVLEYSNKSKIIAAMIVIVPCLFNFLTMMKSPKDGAELILDLDQTTATLQMVFSLLLSVAFVISRLVF